MSVLNVLPRTIIFDTNTNSEPIYLCIGQRSYRVESEESLRYLLTEEYGRGCLHIKNGTSLPLKRVFK